MNNDKQPFSDDEQFNVLLEKAKHGGNPSTVEIHDGDRFVICLALMSLCARNKNPALIRSIAKLIMKLGLEQTSDELMRAYGSFMAREEKDALLSSVIGEEGMKLAKDHDLPLEALPMLQIEDPLGRADGAKPGPQLKQDWGWPSQKECPVSTIAHGV